MITIARFHLFIPSFFFFFSFLRFCRCPFLIQSYNLNNCIKLFWMGADWTSAISCIAASILFWSIYVLEWIHLVLLLYTFVVSCTWQHSYRRCFHLSFFVVSFFYSHLVPLNSVICFVLKNESYKNRAKSILLPLLLLLDSLIYLSWEMNRTQTAWSPRSLCPYSYPFTHIYFSWTP